MIKDYRFVFFSNPYFGYSLAYYEIIELANVVWIPQLPNTDSKLLIRLYRIHHSNRLNSLFTLPFQNLWYKVPLRKLKNDAKTIFIFNQLWSLSPVVKYVKNRFTKAKLVLQISDAKEGYEELACYENEFKRIFDLIVTYDKTQADRYNLSFFHNVHSFVDVNHYLGLARTDVYFCGRAIDRLDNLVNVFQLLRQRGLNCDFWIVNVPPDKQLYPHLIHYNTTLDYETHLKHLANTNCVLYIQQGCAEAIEWRLILALIFGKKIITNVKSIKQYSFYNAKDIMVLDDCCVGDNGEEFNEFILHLNEKPNYRFDPSFFSPVRLLEHIVKDLSL